ncbi:MAG: hypothetical protein Q7S27_03420 [Nanoarchaeota archaeon]|nr:hypothetical protein [Nanoarchaeota archaeon]
MIPHFIRSAEKKRIIEDLNEQFGIEKIPYLLIESGREKIRAFSGNLSKEEILQLTSITLIENIGIYFLSKEDTLRITLDAAHLLKDQITKNILEIDEIQLHDWLRGKDLILQNPIQSGPYIIKYNSDIVGYGKSNGVKIFNYIPKDRRLKK